MGRAVLENRGRLRVESSAAILDTCQEGWGGGRWSHTHSQNRGCGVSELCLFSGINDDDDEIINTNLLGQKVLTCAGEVPGRSRNGDGWPGGSFRACPRSSGHIRDSALRGYNHFHMKPIHHSFS